MLHDATSLNIALHIISSATLQRAQVQVCSLNNLISMTLLLSRIVKAQGLWGCGRVVRAQFEARPTLRVGRW